MPSRRALTWLGLVCAAALLAAALLAVDRRGHPPESTAAPAPVSASSRAAAFVGTAVCERCHATQAQAWKGSHHDRAMTVASEATVLGDFSGASFSHDGVTSRFFRRDGRFMVRTDGPDGKLADFEVKYSFGFSPLQQYLIEFPGGRLQALGIAWDARPRSQGGQRWFHLYPGRRLAPGDPLHWTGIDQTWNFQCADCHSTDLRKNYDAQARRYATTWTDINVGCEACHGPGSNHLEWAKQPRPDIAAKGLTVTLDERRGVNWTITPTTGNATRSAPRVTAKEIDVCARCHARRAQFSDAWHAGQRLADGYRAALIEPGLYYADGQMRDEVFNHGSFLGSRMNGRGVTCADCHDPHTQKLRQPGNAVCATCHAPGAYDVPAHHHHAAGSKGAECAACHMPTTTYMVVDPRHDHSIRIPRPDLTVRFGLPNACDRCHGDRKPSWAADTVKGWFPNPKPGFQTFAEAFVLDERDAPGATRALIAVVAEHALGGFVRASAVQRLGHSRSPAALQPLRDALLDADAQVRAAAAAALGGAGADQRAQWLTPLLGDPVREVRMAAARALAGEAESRLAAADRAGFATALNEYIAAEQFNADRPEGQANLGNLYAAQGRADEAVAAYRTALELDPTFEQAALNLADLQRRTSQEGAAEQTLREALRRQPKSAAARHALGLSLVRQQRGAQALAELARAAQLEPDNARYAYVHAVALNGAGQGAQARRVLVAALSRHPYDRDILLALALLERDAGERAGALGHARRLAEVEPDDPQVRRLVAELEGPPAR